MKNIIRHLLVLFLVNSAVSFAGTSVLYTIHYDSSYWGVHTVYNSNSGAAVCAQAWASPEHTLWNVASLSYVDHVTYGTCNYASAILNVTFSNPCTDPEIVQADGSCKAPDPCAGHEPVTQTFACDQYNTTPGYMCAPPSIEQSCGTMDKTSPNDCTMASDGSAVCSATYGPKGTVSPPAPAPVACPSGTVLEGGGCVTAPPPPPPPPPDPVNVPYIDPCIAAGTCTPAGDPCIAAGTCMGTGTGLGGTSGLVTGGTPYVNPCVAAGTCSGTGTGTDPVSTFCADNPSAAMCSSLGSVSGGDITHSVTDLSTFSFNTYNFSGGGACPSPLVAHMTRGDIVISYQPLCDFLSIFRVGILAVAMFSASLILLGQRSTDNS